MSSAASSRRSSLGNLLETLNITGRDSPVRLRKNPLEPEILVQNMGLDMEEVLPAHLDAETEFNPNKHYQFTKKDPMGNILLSIFEELTHLAKKTNKSMNTDIDDICEKFHNHHINQARKIQHKILQTTADWETSRIERELNSCALNQRIEAPSQAEFSQHDTWRTPRDRADTLKLLPTGSNKFSGTNGMSIVEYLYNLNQVQEQCHLSLKEFYQAMLASTTGAAYIYLMGAVRNGEDPVNIYHNLLIRYDRRLQPEEARQRLYAYKILKSSSLAQAESKIYELAEQTVSAIPEGIPRTVALDYEAIQALFRALPPQSATLARNAYARFSTQLGESMTFAQLSRLLNTYRYSIDNDIKAHGFGGTRNMPQSTGGTKYFKRMARPTAGVRKYTSYNIQSGPTSTGGMMGSNPPQAMRNITQGQWKPRPVYRPAGASGGQNRFNPRPPMRSDGNNLGGWRDQGTGNRTSRGLGGKRMDRGKGANRTKLGQRPQGKSRDYCSLCGKYDHKAVDGCPYMVNDSGRKIPIMPCKDVCPDCPSYIRNRLNHPSFICPFRKNGPLCNK